MSTYTTNNSASIRCAIRVVRAIKYCAAGLERTHTAMRFTQIPLQAFLFRVFQYAQQDERE